MKKSKHKEKIQLELNSNLSDKPEDKELDLSNLDWSVIRGKPVGMNPHNLKIIDKDTLIFEQTTLLQESGRRVLLVVMVMVMIGASIITWAWTIPIIILGTLFTFIGLHIHTKLGNRSVVFDRDNRVHHKQNISSSFFNERGKDTYTDFDDIIAVQFIKEYQSSYDTSNYILQINLVLHDKSRMHVLDWNYENDEARKDAAYLADFLGVPFLAKEANREARIVSGNSNHEDRISPKLKHEEKIQLELNSDLSDKQEDKELDFAELDWSGIGRTSFSLDTRYLKPIDKDTLVFEQTILLHESGRRVFLIGMGMIGVSIIISAWAMPIILIALIMFGGFSALFGLAQMQEGSRSFIFDGYNKVYRDEILYRREDSWMSLFYPTREDTHINFDDIIAVQFIKASQVSNDDSSTYYFYQINLVLHDKSRIKLVNYSYPDESRKDAAHLADFLGVPLLEKESE